MGTIRTSDLLSIPRRGVSGEHELCRCIDQPLIQCSRYHQAHVPIAEQDEVEGHAVRAMYLLTAAADLVRMSPGSSEKAFETAIYRLWDNMVGKKMYITGGIGAIKQWEGFGRNYFLPQGTDEGGCYSETCAAIGCIIFAERLLQVSCALLAKGMHAD